MLVNFFLGPKDKFVNKDFFDVANADLYNEYSWRKYAFNFILDSLRERLMGAKKKGLDYFFIMSLAFHWLYKFGFMNTAVIVAVCLLFMMAI